MSTLKTAPRPDRWRRRLRLLLVVWAALLALMLVSLGTAYLPIDAGVKAAAGIAIAVVKSLLVVFAFMHLGRGPALLRLVAGSGIAALAVMVGLSAIDFGTRRVDGAAVQPPQQLRHQR